MKFYVSETYYKSNLLLTIILPAISVLQGSTTVFYIVYLYWWQELIASLLDGWYHKRKGSQGTVNPAGTRLFLLLIYFVFILVLFGVMINWDNYRLMGINLKVFLFKDWVFNFNLIGIALNEWRFRYKSTTVRNHASDPFSGRMLVMHISIIVSGFVYLFSSNRFPEIFSPQNYWGSVWTVLPFLLLKTAMIRWENKSSESGVR